MTIIFKYYKYFISLVLIVVAFAYGRYSAKPAEVKTQITQKDRVNENKNEIVHTQIKAITTKEPSGAETTVVTTDTVSTTESKTESRSVETAKQTVEAPKSTISLSALAAYDFRDHEMRYGLYISKQFAGPLTAGLWALNNGTIGVSAGVTFP